MSNSKLICYTRLSPNCNKPRSHKIDTITIHHMAGNLTVEQCGEVFAPVSRQASSNYGIGSDGRIALYVDEANRSWCSSSAENDHRAVTIEVANDGGEPDWHVSDKALASLINLCVDICQRNGIKKLNYTGDTSGNLTMHKWFAATGCPGPYLGGKFPYIAAEVNKRLSAATSTPSKYMTYDQFEKKYLGKAVDFDGVAGVQCVDLFDQYLKECFGITGVWCDGAKDLYNKFESYPALVKAFDRIPNTRELIVRKGDVVIWGGGSWGHVGIGNGEGDEDHFVSLEENTLGRHEPTQLVKHYFNGSGGNDGCSPVLGVLRPKSAAEPALKPLDTAIWYKRGDKDKPGEHAIFAIKQRVKALGYKLDDTGGFGGGTESAVKDLQCKMGYKQTGVIGENFVRLVMR